MKRKKKKTKSESKREIEREIRVGAACEYYTAAEWVWEEG